MFRSRRFWFEFHFTSLKVAPVPIIITVSIVTIQIRIETAFKPPSSSAVYSTVITLLVIIPILGSKSHTVMIIKLISCGTRVEINRLSINEALIKETLV